MVKRYFGGVMSLTKPVANSSSASGMFSASSQIQLQAAGNWPSPTAPEFNSAYQSLIDNHVGIKYYVNSVTGSDTNNGLTPATAFASVNKAHTTRNTQTSTSVMIVIYPGTYTVTTTVSGKTYSGVSYASTCFYDLLNSPTIYVCRPLTTIIQFTSSTSLRDAGISDFQNVTSAIYGATILRNNNGKSIAYEVSILNGETVRFKGTIYNSVFREVNTNGNWSLNYDNSGQASGTVDFCTFYFTEAGTQSWTSSSVTKIKNSVFNYSYGTTSATLTNVQVLATNAISPTTYVSTGVTDKGVYYGTYAWYQS